GRAAAQEHGLAGAPLSSAELDIGVALLAPPAAGAGQRCPTPIMAPSCLGIRRRKTATRRRVAALETIAFGAEAPALDCKIIATGDFREVPWRRKSTPSV